MDTPTSSDAAAAAAAAAAPSSIADQRLNRDRFVSLLGSMVNQSEHLVNTRTHTPREAEAARHLISRLSECERLRIRVCEYAEGRPNVIVTLPGSAEGGECVSFMGMHLDVVHADPACWKKHPFTFSVEGDIVYGRGEDRVCDRSIGRLID